MAWPTQVHFISFSLSCYCQALSRSYILFYTSIDQLIDHSYLFGLPGVAGVDLRLTAISSTTFVFRLAHNAAPYILVCCYCSLNHLLFCH